MQKIDKMDKNMQAVEVRKEEELQFYHLTEDFFRVTGMPAFEESGDYNRISLKYQETLNKANPYLTELGKCTAGGLVSFRSDTKRIVIRAKTATVHNMSNMTPIGQCGFDCYAGRAQAEMLFVGATQFDITKQEYQCELVKLATMEALNGKGELFEFQINFPLYSHVVSLEIGLDKGATILPPEDFTRKGKLVFYGTSITQGGCASRPGMAYTNIICRKLNLEQWNLGFSGNGLGEYEVADMMAELSDPLAYVIDYEANAGANGRLKETLRGFIERLRNRQSNIPIVVVSRIPYVLDAFDPVIGEQRAELRRFQSETVEKLRNAGDKRIYFVDGRSLFPSSFDELTIDMVHPTDLGFYHMADKLTPVLEGILHESI